MNARPILTRMAEAKAKMIGLRRIPRAFYLNADDHQAFLATKPDEISALFRSKPRRELGFDNVPVRAVTGVTRDHAGTSKLYCSHGTTVQVPVA